MLLNKTPAKNPTDPFFTELANTLAAAVKRAGCVMSRISISGWAAELQLLETRHGKSRNKISRTLRFYEKFIGCEYIPHIYSGSGFRKKFQQLRAAMKRAEYQTPEKKKRSKVTPVAYEIIKSQGTPLWKHKQDKTECPAFVQLTYNRYENFLTRLLAATVRAEADLKSRQDAQERRSGVVTRRPDELAPLLRSYARRLPDAYEFTGAWLFRFAEIAHKSENWEPGLLKCAWQPRNKFWRRNMERHAGEFTGDPADWLRVLDLVGL